MHDTADTYEVYLRVADEDDARVFRVEHWFADRPAIETIAALFDEAKDHFARLYPDIEAEEFSVELSRLRPADHGRTRIEQR